MQEVTLAAAFIAGLATFFAPCTFTALPGFLAYIAANPIEDVEEHKKKFDRSVLISTLLYLVGFLFVFTALGLTGTFVGSMLRGSKQTFIVIGGIAMILLGLFMLFGEKLPRFRFLFQEKKIDISGKSFARNPLFPVLIGMTNAFAWTPCIGPIFGAILFLAGATTTVFSEGALLMFSYGLGVSVPFIVLAILIGYFPTITQKLSRFAHTVYKINAVIYWFV